MNKPSDEYQKYQEAYDYFNVELFDGRLPPCFITFQRTRNARGYYSPHRFAARNNRTLRTDEIALNPDTFVGATDKRILSTLVHEQTHLWQAHEGKPGRGKYHNRQWARKMMEVGLLPISFDQPGKMTGQSVTHEIISGGRFDLSAERLLATGFSLRWQSTDLWMLGQIGDLPIVDDKQKRNKVKFACPDCEQNAWAKPSARIVCGWCEKTMERRDRG
jgi:hypothetical protein